MLDLKNKRLDQLKVLANMGIDLWVTRKQKEKGSLEREGGTHDNHATCLVSGPLIIVLGGLPTKYELFIRDLFLAILGQEWSGDYERTEVCFSQEDTSPADDLKALVKASQNDSDSLIVLYEKEFDFLLRPHDGVYKSYQIASLDELVEKSEFKRELWQQIRKL
tara:strand:- start:1267 stop:1758 length:492 start_codon:yes stop_codon:yes gene_type:complete